MNTWRKDWGEKGFTMAELLIVVAIIAVLAAIAIPIFTSQLEKSREGTDADTIRNEYAKAATVALQGNNSDGLALYYGSPADYDGETRVLMGPVEFTQTVADWKATGNFEIAGLKIKGESTANTASDLALNILYRFDKKGDLKGIEIGPAATCNSLDYESWTGNHFSYA